MSTITAKLADRIKSDTDLRRTLVRNYDSLSNGDRRKVIAAVVHSGICDDPLVRAIRDFSALPPKTEGLMGERPTADLESILRSHGTGKSI